MSAGELGVTLLLLTLFAVPQKTGTDHPQAGELAPGVRIERAHPSPEERARQLALRAWQPLYVESLASLRRTVDELFERLENSSLASLRDRCRSLRDRVAAVDLQALFPSGDVQVDRVLYGSLGRFRAAGIECLADRHLAAYRLLLEARAGLDWVDRRLAAALSPPLRLPGLDARDPDRER